MATGMDTLFKALVDPSRRKLLDKLHTCNGQTHLDMTRQAYDLKKVLEGHLNG